MMLLFLFLALAVPLLWSLRKSGLRWPSLVPAALAWIWADLVLTANLLSPFSQLNNRPAYVVVAVILSLSGSLLVRWLASRRPVPDADGLLGTDPEKPDLSWPARLVFFAAIALLGLGFCWHLFVALVCEPVNPDSLMYRLPRVWWYLGHGSLSHFATNVDERALFYPFNVGLAYLPLALFGAPAVVLNLPSVAAWAVTAIVTFQMVRWMGMARHIAAFVAFLVAFAPIVFIEATSTNDEIIAGAGVVAGLYFILCYLRAGSRLDLATGALALGCGFGSKLHFFFFWPAVLMLGAWLAWACWRNPSVRSFVLSGRRVRDGAVAVAVAMLLSIPFLIYNRISSPHFAFTGEEVRNSPFSLKVAGQTLGLLTGQLFLSPFPTFEASPKPAIRQRAVDRWNAWWNQHLYADVNQSQPYMQSTYTFRGVTDPMAKSHFENSEWLGLLPWFLVICGAGLAWRRVGLDWLAAALAILMLAWWATYAATMRYGDTVGVYVAYPLAICGSFMAAGFRSGEARLQTWLMWALAGVVAMTHLALCRNIILFNHDRPLEKILQAVRTGRSLDGSSPRLGLSQPLAGLGKVTLLATHWAVPYHAIMKTAPLVSYRIATNSEHASGPVVMAVQANSVFSGYLPVKVSIAVDEGLVYLDTILSSYGPELIFGDASSFGPRMPFARSRYFVFQARLENAAPQAPRLVVFKYMPGDAGLAGKVFYRFALLEQGKEEISTPWSTLPQAALPVAKTGQDQLQLRIEMKDAYGHLIGSGSFMPFLPAKLRRYNAVEP